MDFCLVCGTEDRFDMSAHCAWHTIIRGKDPLAVIQPVQAREGNALGNTFRYQTTFIYSGKLWISRSPKNWLAI
jgi:hypothetical protein